MSHLPTRPSLSRRVAAEMIGTFALVFAGCGAIVVDAVSGGAIGHLGISLTFGLVVMAAIYATGHLSGAHINPAVTFGFALVGRFPWREVPAYISSQCVAAVIAALALALLIAPEAQLGATVPRELATAAAGLEVLLTAFLMFVILAVATDARAVGALAGVAIGGTVALEALFAGPISGASMNPARSLGPAVVELLVNGKLGPLAVMWVYLAGPMLGAGLGALAYEFVRDTRSETAPPLNLHAERNHE